MKFLSFLLKSLARNRVRSLLTGLSIAAAVFILAIIITMVATMLKLDNAGGGAARHVVVQEKYTFPSVMPLSYLDKVRAVGGVKTACPFYWWGGRGKDDSAPPIFGPAVGPDSIDPFLGGPMGRAASPEMVEKFKADKQAILVGIKWHEKYGWKVGDTITLKGVTVPVDLEFHVAGYIIDGSLDDNFLFRYDYMNDTRERFFKLRFTGGDMSLVNKSYVAYISPLEVAAPDAEVGQAESAPGGSAGLGA